MELRVGNLYRHWKGKVYRIVSLAIDANKKGENLVIYERVDRCGGYYRTVDDFLGITDEGIRRFEAIDRYYYRTGEYLIQIDMTIGQANIECKPQIIMKKTIKRSRKEHTCVWCGESIEVGSSYVEQSFVEIKVIGGFVSRGAEVSQKWHLECWAARKHRRGFADLKPSIDTITR